jgi:heavy metal sensor kinase
MRKYLGTTLRGRLTVLYGALLAFALALYAIISAFYFLHTLIRQMDTELARDSETVEAVLTFQPDGQIALRSHEGEARAFEHDRGYMLEVWSSGGHLLYRSPVLDGQALGPPPTLSQSRERPYSLWLATRREVRVLARPHHMEGQVVRMRLALREGPLWEEFWDMVSVLSIGLPLVVLLISLVGYIVAGRALRPVYEMARRASRIGVERLNERLDILNPEDELGRLGTAFNQTLERLQISFEQLNRFTADASHELRTPLTAIRSVGEVALQTSGDSAYYRDRIGSMLEEADRLTRLVESLLTMSRADAGRIPLQPSEFNLVELAREAATLLDVLAEEKNQVISVEGDAAVEVHADRLILRQALINLIDNAVKYSPRGGSIRVRVAELPGHALLEVQDNGPGIPEQHARKVFQRFYRVDRARSRADGGAGLGLSIVEWAVEAHGGVVQLRQDSGSGCTFSIRLPLGAHRGPASGNGITQKQDRAGTDARTRSSSSTDLGEDQLHDV